MSLLDLFDLSLIGRAESPALEFEDRAGKLKALTFGELELRSNRLAHLLTQRGLERGDRLGFYLANCVEIIDLWLACVKLGVVVVPINVLYRSREIRHITDDAAPRAVIYNARETSEFPDGVDCWDVQMIAREAATMPLDRPLVVCDATTPAALVYTSGTTGASKGAILTQGNFASNALALVTQWSITDNDRYLAALPLFHVHGLGNGLHCWLLSGCHMKLVEKFEAYLAADWFTDYAPTLFFGVPTMYVRLLDVDPERAQEIGEQLRLCVSGSAPLPAAVLESFVELYGQVILERYGMTEALMIASNPYVGERRAGTVGKPLPYVGVRILDEQGEPVADGTAGELWVTGPNVCAGYWQNADATANAFKDGWFRTGDIGVRADDGYITLEGRKSDLIISGGFNIYPREIEELLTQMPGILEASVVGVADPVRGEVPVAYIVADDELDVEFVETQLREQLASFKVPRAFVTVDALPRTALGKVQKHLLPPWSA